MHFNIIKDPWIDVIMTNGDKKTLSLRELFEHGTEIKRLNVVSDLYIDEYTTYLFIVVFWCDARLQKINRFPVSVKKMIGDKTCFDMKEINDYIAMCENEGVSFDVFDEKRPFMQCCLKDTKISPASALKSPIYPTGNNSTFFYYGIHGEKNAEDCCLLTPKEYITSLLRVHAVAPAGGKGYTRSMFQSPIFIIPQGKNLFETIMMMVPDGMFENEDYVPPMWRRQAYEMPAGGYGSGFLANAFVPTRYVMYTTPENGAINKIYYGAVQYKGENSPAAIGSAILEKSMPYVILQIKEGVVSALEIKEDGSSFYDIVGALSNVEGKKDCHYNLKNIIVSPTNQNEITYVMYTVKFNNAKFAFQKKRSLHLPKKVLKDIECKTLLNKYINYINIVSNRLFYAVIYAYGFKSKADFDSKDTGAKKRVKKTFAFCKKIFLDLEKSWYPIITNQVAGMNPEKADELYEDLKRNVRLHALRTYEENTHIESGVINWLIGKKIILTGALDNMGKTEEKLLGTDQNNNQLTSKNQTENETKNNPVETAYERMKSLPTGDLYKLRRDLGGLYENAEPFNRLLAKMIVPDSNSDLKRLYPAMTFIADRLADVRNKKATKEKQDICVFLAELYEKSNSGKATVEKILSAKNVYDERTMTQITNIVRMAKKKTNINIFRLAEDIYNWNTIGFGRMRWAEKIGEIVSGNIAAKEGE